MTRGYDELYDLFLESKCLNIENETTLRNKRKIFESIAFGLWELYYDDQIEVVKELPKSHEISGYNRQKMFDLEKKLSELYFPTTIGEEGSCCGGFDFR